MQYQVDRITSASNLDITYTIFSGFRDVAGAGININGAVKVKIKNCIIESCVATDYAGFIYLKDGISFNFSKSFARYCIANNQRDYGNIAKLENTQASFIDYSSCYLCAPSYDLAGDSTFTLNCNTADCDFSNFSRCSAYVGASVVNCFSGTIISVTYVNVHQCDSYSSHVLESGGPGSYTIRWSNHIGNMMREEFWNNAITTMTVYNSVVMSLPPSVRLAYGLVSFVNCYSNYTNTYSDSFTFTAGPPVTRDYKEERGDICYEYAKETGNSTNCRALWSVISTLVNYE